jgi:hypothetical protein
MKASKQAYIIENVASQAQEFESLRLKPVRLGTAGAVELRESAIPLTPASTGSTGI